MLPLKDHPHKHALCAVGIVVLDVSSVRQLSKSNSRRRNRCGVISFCSAAAAAAAVASCSELIK